MRSIAAGLAASVRAGARIAAATLVEARDGLPAPLGTTMSIDARGGIGGNIGAGCHEAEIVDAALAVLNGAPERVLDFVLDDDLLDGSVCGARLRVALWLPRAEHLPMLDAIADGSATATIAVAGHRITVAAKRPLAVVGATDLAAELTRFARAMDFSVTLIDPRPPFTERVRHPDAERILVAWPDAVLPSLLDERTPLVVLSHDVKIDLPAIRAALATATPYIGLLGSRRAQRARREMLAREGFGSGDLQRISGPAGLDLGALTSAQTALSILAEMLAVVNGRGAAPLRALDGSIHRDPVLR